MMSTGLPLVSIARQRVVTALDDLRTRLHVAARLAARLASSPRVATAFANFGDSTEDIVTA